MKEICSFEGGAGRLQDRGHIIETPLHFAGVVGRHLPGRLIDSLRWRSTKGYLAEVVCALVASSPSVFCSRVAANRAVGKRYALAESAKDADWRRLDRFFRRLDIQKSAFI